MASPPSSKPFSHGADRAAAGPRETPAADEAAQGLSPGDRLDHFHVLRRLGRGGMADVYLARDTKLGRKVALKVVRPELARSEAICAHFLREARSTAIFNHPHIVTIFEVGQAEGRPYVALEYLEGQSLRERLVERPPTLPEALRLGASIAEALVEAHRHDILHRDLKPENVVVTTEGRLRVVDFGLAIPARPAAADEEPDEATSRFGTPAYMAPEQWARLPLSPAVDVWALGLILFELIAHRPPLPLDRSPAATMRRALSVEPVPRLDAVAEVPAAIADLVARCLDKDPLERPPAKEARAALLAVLTGNDGHRTSTDGPFRGLRPFLEHDAHQYFGREDEVSAVLERIRAEPLITVVGPSGAGKSSFVRAGVIPRLREQGSVTVLTVRPGADPFGHLARRLLRDRDTDELRSGDVEAEAERVGQLAEVLFEAPRRLALELQRRAAATDSTVVLFVDQLEELFTQGSDPETVRRYLLALSTAAEDDDEPVRVLLTVRDDFMARMAVAPEARRALRHVTVLQTPGREELKRILQRSVASTGYRFEDEALVEDMVAEVDQVAGALPLLQFAGRRLWDERDAERELLLRSAYEAMGGVGGALGRHGDAVVDRLSPGEIDVTRRLLLRLVTPERTRRVLDRNEALDGLPHELATGALGLLVEARLITTSKARTRDGRRSATVELAHESLIHHWPTLSRWLDASRDDHAFLAEADQAAARWDRRGRSEAELWRDDALRDAERALARCREEASPRVVDFIDAAGRLARRLRRRRRLMVGAAIGALAVVIAVLAGQKRAADQARDEAIRKRAEAEQSRAQALREAARAALRGGRMLEARALARSSLELEDHVGGRGLWWQLGREPLVWRRAPSDALFYAVAFSPDGRQILASCQNRAIYVFDRQTGESQALRGHRDQPIKLAMSPEGELVTGGWSGELIWWDRERRRPRFVRRVHAPGLWALDFSHDGRWLLSGGRDGRLSIWDARSRRVVDEIDHGATVRTAAFTPDDRRVVVGDSQGAITVYDRASGARLRGFQQPLGVRGLSIHPSGDRVATIDVEGQARIYDLSDGALVLQLPATGDAGWTVAYDRSGARLALGSDADAVKLVDAEDGRVLARLPNSKAARHVSFSPSGDALAVASFGSVSLWNNTSQSTWLGGHREGVTAVAVDPEGRRAFSGSYHGQVRIWNVGSGTTELVLLGHRATVNDIDLHPSGEVVATTSGDATLRLWQADTGAQLRVLRMGGESESVAFGPKGELVAAGNADRHAYLWRASDGELLHRLGPDEGTIGGVAFDADGSRLAATSHLGELIVWDVVTGRELHRVPVTDGPLHTVVFQDDGQVAVAGSDGTIHAWSPSDGLRQLVELPAAPVPPRIYHMVRHPHDGSLITADSSGALRRWSRRGEALGVIAQFGDEVNAVGIDPGGSVIAGGSDDGTVRLFDASTGRAIWRGPALLDDPVRAFSHRGWRALVEDAPVAGPASQALSAAIERAEIVRESTDGATRCVLAPPTLSLWTAGADEAAAQATVERPRDLAAVEGGCAVTTDGGASLLLADGNERALFRDGPARALGSDGVGTIYLASDDQAVVFDASGGERRRFSVPTGATAIAPVHGQVAVGFRDGSLLLPADGSTNPPQLESAAASPVSRILGGPAGTVVVGFDDGNVGLWQTADGRRLAIERLHGPVAHLLLADQELHAYTHLGEAHRWDLSPFYTERCALLAEIRRAVPVALERGRLVERGPEASHGSCPD